MRWFYFLSELEGAPDSKGIIESHPEILYATQHAVMNKSFMNFESSEEQQSAIDFIILVTTSSRDYISANKIREPLSQAAENVKNAELENIQEYKTALRELFTEYELGDEASLQVLDILVENGNPEKSIQSIISNSRELTEIFGSEDRVAEFLGGVSIHLESYLDNDTNIQISQLNDLGSTEQNSALYSSLFVDRVFQKDMFLTRLSNYGITQNIPSLDGESDTDYLLRIQPIFIEDLDVTQEQKDILLEILNNEIDAEDIHIFRSDPQTFVRTAIESGDATSLFNERREIRRKAGLIGRTQTEISGEQIFNYETGELETTSNYQFSKSTAGGNTHSIPEFYSPIMERVKEGKNGEYVLSSSAGEIPVTMNDINALNNNPEAENNLINLYTNFLETGLERLWPHKDAIFTSLGTNGGFKFNSQDGGYVDSREANELFSTILYVTTENPDYKKTGLSLEETKAAIVRETHGIAGETNVESTGEQGNKLEKSFIDKFTMRNQGDEGRFNYTAFNKALRGDFSPNPQ